MRISRRILGTRQSLQWQSFVEACYQLFLNRQPDKGGLRAYVERLQAGSVDCLGVMREIAASDERLAAKAPYNYLSDPDVSQCLTEVNLALQESLQNNSALREADYEAVWQEVFATDGHLVVGQAAYGEEHKRRFYELCNALGVMIAGVERPRLLEIGVSNFSGMYQKLYPQLVMDALDRPVPVDYAGFTPARIKQATNAERVYSVDLNRPAVDVLIDCAGQYDVVLFAEVLEHLTVHPVELFRALLGLLKPHGMLYVTTPNFFRYENRLKIERWENPQQIYPQADGNWDLHHHYREYGHRELLRFFVDAGGLVKAFHFSSCWDEQSCLPDNPAEYANMVFVVQAA